jgi:two-component system NarL family sensor kinase
MCLASGGATTGLLPIFFLLPISVAFLDRPELTAILGFSVAVGYLIAWVVYSRRDDRVGLPNEVYVQVGCLVWLTVATTALCYVLARRSARVRALLEVRRKLVAEAMQADERHNRRLSEQLHDGPLQNLLAARLDLEDLRENPTDDNFDRVDAALRNTVTLLRTTVTTLHPTVLAQVGLTAAMRDLIRQAEQRWTTVTIASELEEVGRPESQALLHRAASELLANAYKHSRATRVNIELCHIGDAVVLSIADNGVGFDPAVLDSCVAQGHIGLSSLVVGIEEMGGAVELAATAGGGATVTITMPDRVEQH